MKIKWISTRSNKDIDARRDFDGFNVNEELRRLNAALAVASPASIRFAEKAMQNIDEWLTRGGALPERWWNAGTARPSDPGGVGALAAAETRRAREHGRSRSKRRPASGKRRKAARP